jgi:SAM-dependent methyltransferase
MSEHLADHRFYRELAPWWPLISPPEDYAGEAAQIASLLRTAARPVTTVLELGSGGGSNAAHLSAHLSLTLVDLSEDMLAVSRQLNPRCEHLQGDMRTLRLGRAFDAVLVHDAIDYLTSVDELRQAIATVHAHCAPGGVAVLVPDATTETFVPGSECGGADADDGSGARYLEWTWDPDPGDCEVRTEYAFLLRSTDGAVRVVHETHRTGLFPRGAWLRLLTDAGFDAEAVTEETTEDRPRRQFFVAHRPPREGGRAPAPQRRH